MEREKTSRLFSDFPPVTTDAWEAKIVADLKGADYNKKLITDTGEGFNVRPYYRAEDLDGLEYLQSQPGEPPFVRGVQREGNDWIIREDILSADPAESNNLALNAISRGAGAVGLNARSVTTHKQMGELLAGIDLDTVAVNFISSQSYPLTLELFIYELAHRGTGGGKVRGSVNFDPISYLLLHGDFYAGWDDNLDEAVYLLNTQKQHVPNLKAITVNGHYFQDSGSTLVQELAFSLASACEYMAGLTAKGLPVDEIAPHIQFSLATGPDYFMEIAKLRAARLLWTRMTEQFRPSALESLELFIHTTTARWNKSLYDASVNMLRTTTEGMSAALGLADSVTILPFDHRFREPAEFSRRIARNQQLVLREESYLDKIADPAAGSYYIENLTHSIAHHAWELFKETEARGGMIECIRSGFIQDEIAKKRRQKETDIASRKMVILGTNQYPDLRESAPGVVSAEPSPAAETTYKTLTPFYGAEPFEKIRLATEKHIAKGGKRPEVFLLTMGNLAMLRARAGFSTNFFGCAGYGIIDNPGFETIDEGTEAALASGAAIVAICSSDDEYPEIVPGIASRLKSANEKLIIVVAGYPKEHLDAFRAAGVSEFIHMRTNLLESLTAFQARLGITSENNPTL